MSTEYWWEATADDLHKKVTTAVEKIDEQQQYRRTAYKKFLGLYENRKVAGLDSTSFTEKKRTKRLRINIVASCIDTLVAMIMTNKTRPVHNTIGGDYKIQRKGENLTRFSDGQFLHLKLHKRNRVVGKDGTIFGTGFIKFMNDYWSDPKKPRMLAERVFPDEILVDDQDGRYCDDPHPWSMFQHKEISKAVLMRRFPKLKDTIKQAGLIRKEASSRIDIDKPASVVMSWHRPSVPGGSDGRYAMTLTNCTLYDDPKWTSTEETPFPVLPWRWKRRPLGYYGMGVAEELETIQDEIDYCCEQIQGYINLGALALFTKKGANIDIEKLGTNIAMRVLKGDGPPPVVLKLLQVPDALVNHLLWLIQEAYQITGITQMSAAGVKPVGLDSAPAQRELKDTQSQRFQDVAQSWDELHVEETEQMNVLAKELDKKGKGGYKVLVKGPYGAEEINWKDVNLPREKYILEVRPSSALPLTPSARKQEVMEVLDAGLVPPGRALKLLDWPDLEAETRRINAPMDTIQMLIERCLYEEPKTEDLSDVVAKAEPMMLPYAQQGLEMATGEYYRARNSGVPDERLELCRNFMNSLKDLIEEQRQAMMKQAAEMAAAQQGIMPGAPPPPAETTGEVPPAQPSPLEVVPP